MNKIRSLVLGLLIITTSLLSAQNESVKRVHRYDEAPSVTTIYPCSSLEFITPDHRYDYNVAILVDSIYSTEKQYRLYADLKGGFEYPIFELKLANGDTVIVYPDHVVPNIEQACYIEAYLDPVILTLIKKGNVRSIRVWHTYAWRDTAFIDTGQFLENFLTNY